MKAYAAIVFTFFALAMLTTCSGLECWVCTTANHTACEDPLDPARATAAGFKQVCREPSAEEQEMGHAALCRKTHQTVLEKVRVIRSCGYAKSDKKCEGSRNKEVIVESCQCFSDLCNSAGLHQVAVAALALAAVVRAIF